MNMKRQNEDELRIRLPVVSANRSTEVELKVIECVDGGKSAHGL